MSDVAVDVVALSKRFRLYARPWHRAAEWLSLGGSRHTDFWALRDVTFRLQRRRGARHRRPERRRQERAVEDPLARRSIRRAGASTCGAGPSRCWNWNRFQPAAHRHREHPQQRALRIQRSVRKAAPRRHRCVLRARRLHRASDPDLLLRHVHAAGISMFAFLDPDVYIIDEALAVGDAAFQKKCMDHIERDAPERGDDLFVSRPWHVEALCDRAIYLDGGSVRASAAPGAVVRTYLEAIEQRAAAPGTGTASGRSHSVGRLGAGPTSSRCTATRRCGSDVSGSGARSGRASAEISRTRKSRST